MFQYHREAVKDEGKTLLEHPKPPNRVLLLLFIAYLWYRRASGLKGSVLLRNYVVLALPSQVIGRVGERWEGDGGVCREVSTELLSVLLQAGGQTPPPSLQAANFCQSHLSTKSAREMFYSSDLLILFFSSHHFEDNESVTIETRILSSSQPKYQVRLGKHREFSWTEISKLKSFLLEAASHR